MKDKKINNPLEGEVELEDNYQPPKAPVKQRVPRKKKEIEVQSNKVQVIENVNLNDTFQKSLYLIQKEIERLQIIQAKSGLDSMQGNLLVNYLRAVSSVVKTQVEQDEFLRKKVEGLDAFETIKEFIKNDIELKRKLKNYLENC